jgi:hypothetical protein
MGHPYPGIVRQFYWTASSTTKIDLLIAGDSALRFVNAAPNTLRPATADCAADVARGQE